MIQKLRQMVEADSLTTTATTYKLRPQQLSDVLYGRANLSKKMLAKLNFKMFRFYQQIGNS